MRILHLRQHGELWATVLLEDGTALRCPLSVLTDFGLRKGQELSPSTITALRRESQRWSIRHTALRLIARRMHSQEELRRKLLHRFPAEAELIDSVLEELAQQGYIDDYAYAEAFVRHQIERKAVSPQQLLVALRRRGVAPETAKAVVAAALPEDAIIEQVRRAAERKLRLLQHKDRFQQWRAVAGYLGRCGFPAGLVQRVLREYFSEIPGDTDVA